MLKDSIVANLDQILSKLKLEGELKDLWQEILFTLAQYFEKEEFEQKISPLLNTLISTYKKPDQLLSVVDVLDQSIEGFPTVLILKMMFKELSNIRAKEEDKLSQLQDVLSELATPVIRIWKDVLLVPLIGTLDSERVEQMAEKLLKAVSDTGAQYVILDVTGLSVLDTIVSRHLLDIFHAVKLLGSDLVLCGIAPEVAHTLVKVGVDLNMITVKRNLESALTWAIEQISKN